MAMVPWVEQALIPSFQRILPAIAGTVARQAVNRAVSYVSPQGIYRGIKRRFYQTFDTNKPRSFGGVSRSYPYTGAHFRRYKRRPIYNKRRSYKSFRKYRTNRYRSNRY